MNITTKSAAVLILAASIVTASEVRADAVVEWNTKAGEILADAKLGTPPAIRAIALVQVAVRDGVESAPHGASVDAVVAAASRTALARLLPSQQAAIDAAYHAALARVAEGTAKSEGIAAGEKAAAVVLAARADDNAAATDTYRPHTSAGVYVPTAAPAAAAWPQRKPWTMANAAQFRPGPPPALASEAWARDYNEAKAVGARGSSRRTAEQTEIARFWEYSLPPIYFGVVRSVASQPGRSAAQNARLYAATAIAMDDAMIAVFDAKYYYGFWRPATAIRNGDTDGNNATERDAAWLPLIEAPLHPEYPSAHAILASAVGTLLEAEAGGRPLPVLATSSPTAKGATRTWTSSEAFMREVANARIYAGIHYRFSSEAGVAMGRWVGQLAAEKHLQAPQ
jgi:membrane-associated phospholipid phosphatase